MGNAGSTAAAEAIQFALNADDGLTFLRLWNEGEFDKTRCEWPEAPAAVYFGADPLHPGTLAVMAKGCDAYQVAKLAIATDALCNALSYSLIGVDENVPDENTKLIASRLNECRRELTQIGYTNSR